MPNIDLRAPKAHILAQLVYLPGLVNKQVDISPETSLEALFSANTSAHASFGAQPSSHTSLHTSLGAHTSNHMTSGAHTSA